MRVVVEVNAVCVSQCTSIASKETLQINPSMCCSADFWKALLKIISLVGSGRHVKTAITSTICYENRSSLNISELMVSDNEFRRLMTGDYTFIVF